MKYNELTKIGSKTSPRRKGRGISSGRGKTAGRGTKGQGSRKSGGVRPGFEGGQMPLYMRLPKLRGFKSHRLPAVVVFTDQLDGIKKNTIDNHTLYAAGLIESPHQMVKLLGRGKLNSKKDIKLQSASKSAVKAVVSAGGSFTSVEKIRRTSTKAIVKS